MHNALGGGETAMFLFSVFVAALILTGIVRFYALKRSLLDVPNERSSHSVPTPRGGGLAIVATFLCAAGYLGREGVIGFPVAAALTGGGFAVAAIGWLDDHRHVSPIWRFLVHTAAAGWAVYMLGGFPGFSLGGVSINIGWPGTVLAVLGIVWLTNLYNFMDGIDGLAGAEAVTVGGGGALLFWSAGSLGLATATGILAAGAAGFLVWNWPPARIFMGDVGSGMLGYAFGVLAVAGERAEALPSAVWVILLAVFIFDATFTLLRRVMGGERWYTAHRSHAYQRAVQAGMSHKQVTLMAMAVNVLILWPVALLSVRFSALQPWLLAAVAVIGYAIWRLVQRRWRDLQI